MCEIEFLSIWTNEPYGCESWVLDKIEHEILRRWERKLSRKILGGRKIEDRYERTTNEELYIMSTKDRK